MIIFYNKKTGDVIGTVEGRVHDEDTINNVFIRPSNMNAEDIEKYIVPFKKDIVIVEEDVEELRVVDRRTMRVEKVVVGKRKVEKVRGLIPDGVLKHLIIPFEEGKESIYNYKLDLDFLGGVKGISKKNKVYITKKGDTI